MAKTYSTKEILKMVMISRATLYNWLRAGKVPEAHRDRNNYRIFSEEDFRRLQDYKNLIKGPVKSYVVREEMIKKEKIGS